MPEFAVPGQTLGVEEELMGDEQTFVENGEVVACVPGQKMVAGGQAKVVPRKSVRMLKKDDVVYGYVSDLYDTVALIVINAEEGTRRTALGQSYAYLRISEINKGFFAKSFREFVKIGDIVKARVIEIANLGTYLTFSETQLGVVKAFCSLCRSPMTARDGYVVCDECGNRETRKLAGVELKMEGMERRREGPGPREGGNFGGRGGGYGRREGGFRGGGSRGGGRPPGRGGFSQRR